MPLIHWEQTTGQGVKRVAGVKWDRRPIRRLQSRSDRAGGRRLEPTSSRGHVGTTRQRRQEQPLRRGEKRRMWQMAISAILLVLVVTVKLAFPTVMDRYRQQVLHLLGEDTDFVEAFASVGRAVSPGGKLGDAVTAVFGPEKTPAEPEMPDTEPDQESPSAQDGQVVYTADNTPDIACMTQQVLGFAYAPPVDGTLTSCFGYREHPVLGGQKFHYGVDIGAESGTAIRAFAAGTVTVVAEASELGKYVVVSHPGGYSSLYAHCSTVTASSGQQVAMGDPIAEVGDSGMTTGPHLHFELMHDSDYLNPAYYALG